MLELRLVQLGCPVQVGEAEEVASTSSVSAHKALVYIGCAPSATPAPNAASILQYTSDLTVGMLRRDILIYSSCMKGERPGAAVQTL